MILYLFPSPQTLHFMHNTYERCIYVHSLEFLHVRLCWIIIAVKRDLFHKKKALNRHCLNPSLLNYG